MLPSIWLKVQTPSCSNIPAQKPSVAPQWLQLCSDSSSCHSKPLILPSPSLQAHFLSHILILYCFMNTPQTSISSFPYVCSPILIWTSVRAQIKDKLFHEVFPNNLRADVIPSSEEDLRHLYFASFLGYSPYSTSDYSLNISLTLVTRLWTPLGQRLFLTHLP